MGATWNVHVVLYCYLMNELKDCALTQGTRSFFLRRSIPSLVDIS